MEKCDKGWDNGECCCNCKFQLTLKKHPHNQGFGKGYMSENCGYVCVHPFEDGSNSGNAIYFEKKHGFCEMHTPKTK